jgi:hypothetical protein
MRGLSKSEGVFPFVSRGGIKLAAAFNAFGLDPKASSRSIIGARPEAVGKGIVVREAQARAKAVAAVRPLST